jgi:hypothetical protein
VLIGQTWLTMFGRQLLAAVTDLTLIHRNPTMTLMIDDDAVL